jgi:C4-dicarboxylate transporter, DctM subunit
MILSNGWTLVLMASLFLGLGYMGVPVAFALMAGVLIATALTPISLESMVGQMFHGIDSETMLAVPFFLLVGELMTSANVTQRMVVLSQTLVGHPRRMSRCSAAPSPRKWTARVMIAPSPPRSLPAPRRWPT